MYKTSKRNITSFVRKSYNVFKRVGFGILDLCGFFSLAYLYGITHNQFWSYVAFIYITINLFALLKIKKADLLRLLVIYIILLVTMFCLILFGSTAKAMANITGINIDTWMNFLGALSGAAITVLGAIWFADMQKKQEQKEKNEHAKLIIETFVSLEIDNNFLALDEYEQSWAQEKVNFITFDVYMKEDMNDDYYYNQEHISVGEYNKIKYDIIKYESDDVIQIVKLYVMFNILKKKENLADLNKSDLQRIRQIYLEYINKN